MTARRFATRGLSQVATEELITLRRPLSGLTPPGSRRALRPGIGAPSPDPAPFASGARRRRPSVSYTMR
jgi:hypothetical protein